MRLLVLGAGGSAADNWIKSIRLAHPDAWILGVDSNPFTIHASCADTVRVIDTTPADSEAHAAELAWLVNLYRIDYVHAQPDEETLFLADLMPGVLPTLALPKASIVRLCQDKLSCAQRLGKVMAPESASYGAWVAGETNLKGAVWMRARTGAGSLAAKLVDSPYEANAWATVWKGRLGLSDFMVSEYLPGRDLSYTSVWIDGQCVGEAARERVEYANTRTPSGQSSSPSVARLHHDEAFYAFCQEAVRRIANKPHGVFYVDTKEDDAGHPRVTEVNAGRFNTTQDFYAHAGCNLPSMHLLGEFEAAYKTEPSRPFGDVFWVRKPDMRSGLVPASRIEGVLV